MAIKSISDLYNFSLFIFDLDNTLYNEEDYLFQAYRAIAEKFTGILPCFSRDELFAIIIGIYREQGRDKLFDKFLDKIGLDKNYIPECLKILRTFNPEEPLKIYDEVRHVLGEIKKRNKKVFILTNGNVDQQKNKILHISWEGLNENISFVYANEIEPKPSPAGVYFILEKTGIKRDITIIIGDSERDRLCAYNSGITFFDVQGLPVLVHNSLKTGKSGL
jgi:phosphoglycolate phosphatase-like HAD superfamily hydrolase